MIVHLLDTGYKDHPYLVLPLNSELSQGFWNYVIIIMNCTNI